MTSAGKTDSATAGAGPFDGGHTAPTAIETLEVRSSTRDCKAVDGRWFLLPVGGSATLVPRAIIDSSRDGHAPTVAAAHDRAQRFARAWNCHDDLLLNLKNVLPLVEWAVNAVDPMFKPKAERSVANIRAALVKAAEAPAASCHRCDGRGYVPGDPEGAPIEDCDLCKGTGRATHPTIGGSQ